ncbi:fork head domain-containing protein [Colletotrichum zoysiae]|uniref:Fork head domain-containing protein n=1 Tax=Colletotrichum zoysiae TaxID=1216348 RepID=A0AAD9HEI8_9PEZI|nr:fork head domain-containing protein [Colletotrichum zoysiae]
MPGGDVSRQQQYIASTTQAPSTMVVGPGMVGDYNTMASAHQQHQFPVHDHQRQGYYHLAAVSQPYQSPNMNQTAWPSPQAMSSDDFDNVNGANANYSYRGQAVATAYHPSTLSPRSWPAATQASAAAHPAPTASFDLPLRPQEPLYDGLSNHVSMPTDDLRGADLQLHLHYDNGAVPHGFEPPRVKSERFDYESSPSVDAPGSPYPGTPASFCGEFCTESDMMPDLGGQLSPPPPQKTAAPPPKEGTVGETPYAKLIHKALLDAPRHSMTLQELYKWFKDNTDKPHKAEGGGWMNSIRHNLSMNEAFERRPQALPPNTEDTKTGTEKRVSEWFLVSKYLKEIKPTTHFRDNVRNGTRGYTRRGTIPGGGAAHRRNSPPRSVGANHYPNPDYPNRSMPGRAISGRRGGRATTSARNARRQRSQTGSVSPILGGGGGGGGGVHHLQHYPYSPAHFHDMQRSNAGTPKGHVEGMRHHPVMGHHHHHMAPPAPLPSNGGGGAAPAVAFMGPDAAPRGLPQAYQLQQFGMADVSGVYTSSPPADDVIYGWGPDASHM